MHSTKDRKVLEEALYQYMATLATYFQEGKLKLSTAKRESTFRQIVG